MNFLSKSWKWLALTAAVIGAAVVAYFAGGSRGSGEEAAAVDATKANDAVQAAEQQAIVARAKMAQLAAQSAAQSKTIATERTALAAGGVDTTQIDEMLRQAGVLK